MPIREGVFSANFTPDILDRFRELCKLQSKSYSKVLERLAEQQFGITNDLNTRMQAHERNGWSLIDHTSVPSSGQKVFNIEKLFKKWLKREIGLMKGTTENWSTSKMEVQSLAELKVRSGMETDLF